jgi:hypothetical protein
MNRASVSASENIFPDDKMNELAEQLHSLRDASSIFMREIRGNVFAGARRRSKLRREGRGLARIIGPAAPRTRINRRQGKHITALREIAMG